MNKENLKISNGHYFYVHNDKNYLIDTGSPFSFGESDVLFGGNTYTLKKNAYLETINQSGLFHLETDGLIGMDILKGHIFTILKNESKIEFGKSDRAFSNIISIESAFGDTLLVKVQIDNLPCKALFDTGAWIGYASSQLVSQSSTIGDITDFNPIIGQINTTKHDVSLTIGDKTTKITVGKMTSMIEMPLKMLAVNFVFGLNQIDANAICINLQENIISF